MRPLLAHYRFGLGKRDRGSLALAREQLTMAATMCREMGMRPGWSRRKRSCATSNSDGGRSPMLQSTRLFCVLATSWIVVLLMVGGCASSGRKIQSDFVKSIKVGTTTKHDVIALFGEPQEWQAAARTDTWVYAYAKSSGFGSSSQRLDLGFENNVVVS